MRTIVCSQLVDDVLDMKIDGVLGNTESIGYLFVLETVANQLQHFQLSRSEVFFTQMLGQESRHFCRNLPFAGMNGSDHSQQIILRHALENVAGRSRTKCTLDLAVA